MEYHSAVDSIFVIESLRPEDPRTGSSLFDNTINNTRLPVRRLFECDSEAKVDEALRSVTTAVERDSLKPIVHLTCHGSPEGLEWGDRRFWSWERLREPLVPLNRASKNHLVLGVASCDGGRVIGSMDHASIAAPCPFWLSVGAIGDQPASALLPGFSQFYRQLLNGRAGDALKSLKGYTESIVHCVAERMFLDVFDDYVALTLNPEELEKRTDKLVDEGLPRDFVKQMLAGIESLEREFYRLRATFLHIDTWPEIRDRFASRFADAFSERHRDFRPS